MKLLTGYAGGSRLRAAAATLLLAAALAAPGCIKLAGAPPPPAYTPPTPPPPPPPPAPRSLAYDAFDKLREDILAANPGVGRANCAIAVGVDVSGSAHVRKVLAYSIEILTDMCRYFLTAGDKVIVVPWDQDVREEHVKRFTYSDADTAVTQLNAAFSGLKDHADPSRKGSNLLDARGYCMEQALAARDEDDGKAVPVVLIFTDLVITDFDPAGHSYDAARLTGLRRDMGAGEPVEFEITRYAAPESVEVYVHWAAGTQESAAAVDETARRRSPAVTAPSAPSQPAAPPPPRGDGSGLRTLLAALALLSVLALIGLPFAWQHRLAIGDTRETIRAFGGRVLVQSGRGISPRGVVFLPVADLEDQPLFSIEGKGTQLMAIARRGVRLNEGRTELVVPTGRRCTLRIAIDGVPGEQILEVNASEFFATNTGPIIGMIVAFVVIVACIIG